MPIMYADLTMSMIKMNLRSQMAPRPTLRHPRSPEVAVRTTLTCAQVLGMMLGKRSLHHAWPGGRDWGCGHVRMISETASRIRLRCFALALVSRDSCHVCPHELYPAEMLRSRPLLVLGGPLP